MDSKEEKYFRVQEPTFQEIVIKFREGTSQRDVDSFFEERQPTLRKFAAEKRRSFDSDPEFLDALQEEAARNLGRPIPSLRLFWRVRLIEPIRDDEFDELVKWFADDGRIEYAARAALPAPPPVVPDYRCMQGYLDPPNGTPPQGGVGAECAWDQGGDGSGVRVCDCEYGFRPTHNDLPYVNVISNLDQDLTVNQEHGTSVLGVLAGQDNSEGVVGICHGATMLFASESGNHRTDCLKDVIKAVGNGDLEGGDVVLLEMQTAFGLPAEYDGDVHAAVTTLVGLNVVVVAAAGNADVSLDDQTAPRGTDKFIWRKGHDDYDDSGAILVGAGHSSPAPSFHIAHAKTKSAVDYPGSVYGSRVNCQGWGNNVVTAGKGDLYNTDGLDNYYTHSFSGTSSAAAIVTGVVACLQSYAKASLGNPLQPSFVRYLLSQEVYGTPQNDEPPGNTKAQHPIGPLPDLCRLIPVAHLRPDVYMRDHVSDAGVEPYPGPILCWSPDIIVRQSLTTAPETDYGVAHWDEDDLGQDVRFGQDNYIYIRLHNRGGLPDDVKVYVYWTEPSAFLHPIDWSPVGMLEVGNVLPNEHRVVGPLVWPEADIPEAGHYCLIGVAGSEADFVPVPDEFLTVSEYLDFVRRHNNICYRNVEVVDMVPGSSQSFGFLLRGLPDRADLFRLEVNHWLPAGARVEVEVMAMRHELELAEPLGEATTPGHYPPDIVFDPSPDRPPLVIQELRLRDRAAELVRVYIALPDDVPPGVYLIYADQCLGEMQLGRVNCVIRVSTQPIS